MKWEENWGHIFNPETMQEGKHRSIDARIAELKEELDRYCQSVIFFDPLFFGSPFLYERESRYRGIFYIIGSMGAVS